MEVLRAGPAPAEAEAELRDAVTADRFDPERWLALVLFLAQTKQMEKAEQALRDAEGSLRDRSPMGLARCSEALGQAYGLAGGQDAQKKTKAWYERATQWYKAAQKAKPDDPEATHQLVEFLLRSGQLNDAESQLTVILEKNRTKIPRAPTR